MEWLEKGRLTDAFVKDFKSDLFLNLTFPKRIKHVCGILIGQDFLHYPRI